LPQFEKRRGYRLQTELPAFLDREQTTAPRASARITARLFPM